jgi:hypothetical protein
MSAKVEMRVTVAQDTVMKAIKCDHVLLEGSRLAPASFAAATRTLLERLREHAITVGGVRGAGASMFMDDAATLLETLRQVGSAVGTSLDWGYLARHDFDLENKAVAGLLGPRKLVDKEMAAREEELGEMAKKLTILWAPSETTVKRRAARLRVETMKVTTWGTAILGYRLGEGEQLAETMRRANEQLAELEATPDAERSIWKLSQILWAWEAHGRADLERLTELLPPLKPEEKRAMEWAQIRALGAIWAWRSKREQTCTGR